MRLRALHERLVLPQRTELLTQLEAEARTHQRANSESRALFAAAGVEADVGEQSSDDSSGTEQEVFPQNAPASIPDPLVFLSQDYEKRRDPLEQVQSIH